MCFLNFNRLGFVYMLTQEIRRKFLQYFKDHRHSVIASSSVVPHDDPTLLFNNAGMNQFKDVFLGKSLRDYQRAVTSQKCIRVGGKHNDLENVGHTSRHLTFFEMLGNFSFGDYFKEDAIKYAWEVSVNIFGLDADRIWPTVFRDDDEAFELWKKYVPEKRITRFGEKENFWTMGDTGPCGPCSELLYDRGIEFGSALNPLEDASGERYLEFWNLVFMQFNRSANGAVEPLPKPSIDTGAGLERVISLKMGVDSVFETDVLRSIIARVEEVSGVSYQPGNERSAAFRVIADHLRCLAFAIADGVQPSNVDRGYVLRKVLRRAVRYGRMLGLEDPFLAKVLPTLVKTMGSDYKELEKAESRVAEILTVEEEAFIRTLRRGGNLLNQVMEKSQEKGKISGDDAFKLKDTYGFPLEEIQLMAKDEELSVDLDRYQQLELEAKERSRSVHKTTQQIASENLFADYIAEQGACEFVGYHATEAKGTITALVFNGQIVDHLEENQEGWVILNKTSFYAEMGGQVGDTGFLENDGVVFEVTDCQAPFKGIIAHIGKVKKGVLRVGSAVEAEVDAARRQKIANNHTATHLLHWALHVVCGEHVKQAGSVVDPTHLRFDFSHHKALTHEEMRRIEDLVNAKIRINRPLMSYEISYDEAQKREDIQQIFGEKYSSIVRVIDIDFSKELCGGTHTSVLGNIGYFRIEKESSIAAGIRRIQAVTGAEAEALAQATEDQVLRLASLLKVVPSKVEERIQKLLETNKELMQDLKVLKTEQLKQLTHNLLTQVRVSQDVPILTAQVTLSAEELRACADEVSQQLKSGVIVLGTVVADKCHLMIRISDDLVARGLKANEMIKELAVIIEGTGGGKPNNAQAGGKALNRLPNALEHVEKLLLQS